MRGAVPTTPSAARVVEGLVEKVMLDSKPFRVLGEAMTNVLDDALGAIVYDALSRVSAPRARS